MALSEEVVLNRIKTAFLAFSLGAPAIFTYRVYVYPDEYDLVDTELPFVAIRKGSGSESYREGMVWSDWSAEVVVYLHEGEIAFPSEEHQALELAARQWKKSVQDWYFGSDPFSGVAAEVGGNLEASTDPVQWNLEPYHGVVFNIPVRQEILV